MADKIQLKRDLAANWTSANPILSQGEEGLELDTGRRKVGDGINPWNVLPYDGNTDHGLLGGLSDDDHPQYHNDARGDVRYYQKTELDGGQLDNRYFTEAEINAQQLAQDNAIALKYDASNPNGYETPAQLNSRDSANRDRSNHTGTQLAVTISDLPAAIAANETDTTLTIVGNTLRYVGEDGTNQDIDLSIYLDDTNAARIESGVINGTTGIATFTRDDSSTFTVDMSAFLDGISDHGALSGLGDDDHPQYHNDTRGDVRYYQKTELDGGQLDNRYFTETEVNASQAAQDTNIGNNTSNISSNTSAISANSGAISTIQSEQITQDAAINLNTAKVSADGPVSTHSDVDLTGIATGDSVKWDGAKLIPESILNGFTVFPIWAEESGGLTNNNTQYSFGNGATGNIGLPLATDCELFAVGINADTVGTSVSINFRKYLTTVHTQLFDNFVDESQVVLLPTPVLFSVGDILTFQTNTETGAFSDVRVVGWFRLKATAVFPTPDRSTVSTSGNFTSTGFATVPGASTTVVLSDTGTVDATAVYSAARSGGTNSEAQFRVVISGDNGPVFNDTLSTFNDTGPVSHFVENLPAGIYTVTLEAAVTQPIDFATVVLTATAVED